MSQLGLASDAEVSQRHLSFLESGRASPSREMVLLLAERLAVPLRERNLLLVAAGFAPAYRERSLDDPALAPARRAVEGILDGHEPYPALAVDRHWTLVQANRAASRLLAGASAAPPAPPVNVLRLSLHPEGLAPRIVNHAEWRAHVLARLARQLDQCADPGLAALLEELEGYPAPAESSPRRDADPDPFGGIAAALQLATDDGRLSFISTTTVFGSPVDICLSELAIESFFPADAGTAQAIWELSGSARE